MRSRQTGRAAAVFVCAVALMAGAAGCKSSAQDATTGAGALSTSTASSSGADAGCVAAMTAVSTYGPQVVQDAVQAKETIDKAEIDVLVGALNLAADAVSDPSAKQSVGNLANAYQSFKDSWNAAVVPSLDSVLADTASLKSLCGN
jgi:hypothetical protein